MYNVGISILIHVIYNENMFLWIIYVQLSISIFPQWLIPKYLLLSK